MSNVEHGHIKLQVSDVKKYQKDFLTFPIIIIDKYFFLIFTDFIIIFKVLVAVGNLFN